MGAKRTEAARSQWVTQCSLQEIQVLPEGQRSKEQGGIGEGTRGDLTTVDLSMAVGGAQLNLDFEQLV